MSAACGVAAERLSDWKYKSGILKSLSAIIRCLRLTKRFAGKKRQRSI